MERKMCKRCKKQPATLRYVELAGGQVFACYLCTECAGKKFLESVLRYSLETKMPDFCSFAEPAEEHCDLEECDFSSQLSDISSYQSLLKALGFDEAEEELEHDAGCEELRERIFSYSMQLEDAVEREEFEKAAKLRDKILELKKTLHK